MGKGGSFFAGVLVTAVAGCAAAIAYKMFKEKINEECCCRYSDDDDDCYDCDCGCEDECSCGCDDGFDCDFVPCESETGETEYIDCAEKNENEGEEPTEKPEQSE